MVRCALMAAVLVSAGCLTAEEERLRDACGGDRPLRGYCSHGLGWSDCGGTEPQPRLGCDDGACFWFVGGCVAKGFRPSECPADDSCCQEDAWGRLGPFSGEHRAVTPDWLFAGWGTEPWSPEREEGLRTVSVDLAPVTADGSDILCSGEGALHRDLCSCPELPSGDPDVHSFVGVGGSSFTVWMSPPCISDGAADLGLRVSRDPDGRASAWVCLTPQLDVMSTNPCENAGTPICAESGTVTFEAFPRTQAELDAMRLELSVVLDDGRTMELRF